MTRPKNYRSALEDFFPRDPAAPVVTLAEAVRTAADMTGQGGLFADNPSDPDKPMMEKVAEMIATLGGWPTYAECGEKLRRDLKGAARWGLIDVRGDLDKIERAYLQMINDPFQVKVCHSCSNPYTVARRLYAVAAKLPKAGDNVRRYVEFLKMDEPESDDSPRRRAAIARALSWTE